MIAWPLWGINGALCPLFTQKCTPVGCVLSSLTNLYKGIPSPLAPHMAALIQNGCPPARYAPSHAPSHAYFPVFSDMQVFPTMHSKCHTCPLPIYKVAVVPCKCHLWHAYTNVNVTTRWEETGSINALTTQLDARPSTLLPWGQNGWLHSLPKMEGRDLAIQRIYTWRW